MEPVRQPYPDSRLHQTTKDRCRVYHIGLDTRETLVIESIFRMNPELGSRFVFGEPTPDDAADLIFVNGDSNDAVQQWTRLSQQFPHAVAIMATSEARDFGSVRTIRKPLAFRNFSSILDAITSTGKASGESAADSSKTLQILVVDDSFPARQFMKLKLEELVDNASQICVDFADSGTAALQCVSAKNYDLIFLDVIMPGMDGYEVCAQLKKIRPTRIAMLTSQSSPVDFSRGKTAGCDNYLTKPPNDIDLRVILRLTALRKLNQLD